jgi:4-aminobutyrate aminotransferase / (S)-3-amino-2-methylpropionate transaminase / 5-aminovalerate transaminase
VLLCRYGERRFKLGEILFNMEPEVVENVETKFRRIVTPIPVPESLPIIKKLQQYEPLSMGGQPLVVWDRSPQGGL